MPPRASERRPACAAGRRAPRRPLAVSYQPAAIGVGEALVGEQREPSRLGQPARIERRAVELPQPLGDLRVVVQESGDRAAARSMGAPERAVRARTAGPSRNAAHCSAASSRSGRSSTARALCERRERHAVPGREGLVVERGLRPSRARLEHPAPELGQPLGRRRPSACSPRRASRTRESTVAPSKFPAGVMSYSASTSAASSPSSSRTSAGRPDEGRSLDPVRVGVGRRRVPAMGQPQLAHAGSRASRRRPRRGGELPSPRTPAGRRARAGRCRTASSRSAGRARSRRPRSGGSRRRAGRGCLRRPCGRASARPSAAPPRCPPAGACGAGTRARTRAGTSGRRRTRRGARRAGLAGPGARPSGGRRRAPSRRSACGRPRSASVSCAACPWTSVLRSR